MQRTRPSVLVLTLSILFSLASLSACTSSARVAVASPSAAHARSPERAESTKPSDVQAGSSVSAGKSDEVVGVSEQAKAAPNETARVEAAPREAAPSEVDESERLIDVVTEHGQRARGLYFNAPMAKRLGAKGMIAQVKQAGMDAVVLDLKDGEGRVSYDTKVAALAPSKKIFFKDPEAYIRELKDAGIYTIARIVCFSDPVLPHHDPSRAVMDARPGREDQVWNKGKNRNSWLDPYNERNHDVILAVTQEAQAMGFDEIQLDYIRFPVDEGVKFARFPAQSDKLRRDVIMSLLRRIDLALHIPVGADVFGLTAFRKGDPAGLGQSLEEWTRYIEVFSPMLYVNGMGNWMKHQKEGRAGLLVEAGVKALRDRVGPQSVIRPFLQAFSSGADYYDPRFIAEQIRGARSGGGDGFLFWHPGSNFGMVRAGMMGPARGVSPFPQEERRKAREAAWGRSSSPSPEVARDAQDAKSGADAQSESKAKTVAADDKPTS
jgi:hypothetical protein